MTETFTLLHGTTEANAIAITSGGFRPSEPFRAARVVEEALGLPPRSIFSSETYAFARGRRDLDRVHVTTRRDTAVHYSLPEQLQDAIDAAFRLLSPPGEDETGSEYRKRASTFAAQIAPRVVGRGVVLRIEVPWEVIGENAFGRKLSREEFRDRLGDELPETFSLPIAALEGANVSIEGANVSIESVRP